MRDLTSLMGELTDGFVIGWELGRWGLVEGRGLWGAMSCAQPLYLSASCLP
jgi:hypothetical protein